MITMCTSLSICQIYHLANLNSKEGEKQNVSNCRYELKISDCSELHSFLTNSEKYSLEHFIIGEKANLSIKTDKLDFSYEYAPPIKKYRNSLFNYIFIQSDYERFEGEIGLDKYID